MKDKSITYKIHIYKSYLKFVKKIYFNEMFRVSAKQIYDPHPCLQTTLSHVPTPIPKGWIGWRLERKPLNRAISAASLTNCYKLTLLEWSQFIFLVFKDYSINTLLIKQHNN